MSKARTKADILNHPLMSKLSNGETDFWIEEESDGKHYWGFVKDGYCVYGNAQKCIHETTIKDFCDVLNDAEVWEDDPDLFE